MEVLEEALERAEEGRGGVIGVVAEPGVGKSRLCHEFAERCRARGIEVYEAQAQAHGQAIPFLPVLQMMRGYFGIEDRDTERVAREKIAGRLLLLDPDFADDLPLVFDFLAVPDPERPAPQVSGEARERLLRGVIRRLYRVPGRNEVVVNVIEDLHWMDEGSEAFLAEMVGAVEGTATLAVVNFRPEYEAEWADSPVYRRMTLMPLGPESTRELLADLAGGDPSIDGLAELIHERTGGNPFFIEEVVRELVEAGNLEGERGAYRLTKPVEDTGVPATVQAILAARIDRLDGGEGVAASGGGDRQGGPGAGASHRLRARRRGARRGPQGADRRRLPVRGRDLPRAGAGLQPSTDPRGRLRLPARAATGHRACGDGPGDDRAQLRPPRRARGADRPAPGAGRPDAGGRALERPRRALGRLQPPAGRTAAVGEGQ